MFLTKGCFGMPTIWEAAIKFWADVRAVGKLQSIILTVGMMSVTDILFFAGIVGKNLKDAVREAAILTGLVSL